MQYNDFPYIVLPADHSIFNGSPITLGIAWRKDVNSPVEILIFNEAMEIADVPHVYWHEWYGMFWHNLMTDDLRNYWSKLFITNPNPPSIYALNSAHDNFEEWAVFIATGITLWGEFPNAHDMLKQGNKIPQIAFFEWIVKSGGIKNVGKNKETNTSQNMKKITHVVERDIEVENKKALAKAWKIRGGKRAVYKRY